MFAAVLGVYLWSVLTEPPDDVTRSVRALRRAFDLGAISLADWGIAVVPGFIGVMWFEVRKAVSRR